ncbi:MAG: hypothetical protein HOO96_18300, partial [Polyangiaceae bacterium]|nr:hypothetical protein [Polyangiaceae bacterium]
VDLDSCWYLCDTDACRRGCLGKPGGTKFQAYLECSCGPCAALCGDCASLPPKPRRLDAGVDASASDARDRAASMPEVGCSAAGSPSSLPLAAGLVAVSVALRRRRRRGAARS